jgi:hypothetical protein
MVGGKLIGRKSSVLFGVPRPDAHQVGISFLDNEARGGIGARLANKPQRCLCDFTKRTQKYWLESQ